MLLIAQSKFLRLPPCSDAVDRRPDVSDEGGLLFVCGKICVRMWENLSQAAGLWPHAHASCGAANPRCTYPLIIEIPALK
jgi:hypothetical protein